MSCSTYRGTRAFLTAMRAHHDLDTTQAQSVYHAARRKARARTTAITTAQWQALVDERLDALTLDENVTPRQHAHARRYLLSVREDVPPDPATFAGLRDLPERAEKARRALDRQVLAAAALRGTTTEAVRERLAAYRAQYLSRYRALPAALRPDPPAEWITGYTSRDMMAVSSPQDRATQYAMYRVQADPGAFALNPTQRFASIDLETAGPEGKDGFIPANGAIIEVGVVEYDVYGNKTSRYSQLVRPPQAVLDTCGTGAVDVHQITVDDVRDAPRWDEVAPHVAARLDGRVMLAQNSPFERDWLAHHMPAAGQDFDRQHRTVDTLTLARQHFSDLPSHRLSAICERVGVAYTDGHRAEHDADVAAQAFFRMRDRIHATWAANPARARAPQPPAGAGVAVPGVVLRSGRLSAGSFDPRAAQDAWAIPAPGFPAASTVGEAPLPAPRAGRSAERLLTH